MHAACASPFLESLPKTCREADDRTLLDVNLRPFDRRAIRKFHLLPFPLRHPALDKPVRALRYSPGRIGSTAPSLFLGIRLVWRSRYVKKGLTTLGGHILLGPRTTLFPQHEVCWLCLQRK